ncbi:MAG TPA: hypothetical protein DCE78_03280 [Bacteroidetes bacterium]|nr:hypothetical protein [Bacteroidota bacterium]
MGIVEIALTGSLVLLGISVLLIVVFGVKNVASGKHEWSKIAIIFLPFALFGVTFGVTGNMTESALITFLVMIVLMVVLIFMGGLRSSFKF